MRNLPLILLPLTLVACSSQDTAPPEKPECRQLDDAAKFVAGADENDNGKVEQSEFRMAMLKNGALQLSEAQIATGFKRFDTDDNGELTFQEMQALAQKSCDDPSVGPLFP